MARTTHIVRAMPGRKPTKAPKVPIVNHLAAWRVRAGMTQAQLAEAAGRDQTMVSRYERHQVPMPLEAMTDFARVLGIQPLQLFRDPGGTSIDAMLDGLPESERERIAAMVAAYIKNRN